MIGSINNFTLSSALSNSKLKELSILWKKFECPLRVQQVSFFQSDRALLPGQFFELLVEKPFGLS